MHPTGKISKMSQSTHLELNQIHLNLIPLPLTLPLALRPPLNPLSQLVPLPGQATLNQILFLFQQTSVMLEQCPNLLWYLEVDFCQFFLQVHAFGVAALAYQTLLDVAAHQQPFYFLLVEFATSG